MTLSRTTRFVIALTCFALLTLPGCTPATEPLAEPTAEPAAEAQPEAGAYTGSYFKRATLLVADMDRALQVYRDVLGFELEGITESGPDSYSYPVFQLPKEARLRFAHLNAGTEQIHTLALEEVTGIELPRPEPPYVSTMVLRVPDLQKVYDGLEALGLEVLEPKTIEVPQISFIEGAFIDFDGHLVVIYQLLEPQKSE
jgi:catechol 2,3-dioxygenase-like lactoylglutathione lyase family enzyme